MIHLGDITKLNGKEIPIVDVICGGSPCQDLSVAGTRSGLDGERSGLFMEQIRIIKEMRSKDAEDGRAAELIRPRWMVWENVCGALSSGKPKGGDFQRVLTEIVRVVEPDAPDVPMPVKGWPKAGCLYDDMGRWSISWRVTDAQFFGLAQRRRRIALVADFAGLQAPEVIFDPQYRRKTEAQESAETVGDTGRKSKRKVLAESESLFGDSEESAEAGEGTSCSSERSAGKSISALSFQEIAGKPGGGKGILIQDEHTGALVGQNVQSVVAYGVTTKGNGDAFISEERHTTISSGGGMPGQGYPTVLVGEDYVGINGEVAGTLDASYYKGCGEREGIEREVVCYGISPYASNAMMSDNPNSGVYEADTSRTLDLNGGTPACNQGGIAIVTVSKQMGISQHRASYNQGKNAKFDFSVEEEQQPTLTAKGPGAVMKSKVRRLTPEECEALQGFPRNWTVIGEPEEVEVTDYEYEYDSDGNEISKTPIGTHKEIQYFYTDENGKRKRCADSARYKALGNSIAVGYANKQSGFWMWLMKRISATYERSATMGSLFSGIGGFELAWEFYNGKGSALWASEIESFPIQVTKARFGDDG